MNDILRISLFGNLEIERNGKPVQGFASRKAQALLAYMARNSGLHARERLATMLWDDRPQDRSLGNLRVVITSIRKQLGPFVTITRQSVGLNRESAIWIDTNQFEADVLQILGDSPSASMLDHQSSAQLEEALTLVTGEFLHGFNIRNAREFEAWATFERERIQHRVMTALEVLLDAYLDQRQYQKGIPWAQLLTRLEPLHERGHQQLILLLHGNNQRNAALAHFESMAQLFEDEMSITPSAESVQLQQQILANEIESVTQSTHVAPPTVANVARTLTSTLPVQLTPLIGRDREHEHLLDRLLDAQCRLLTVVGPGGIGKTRLSLAVAQTVQTQAPELFPDGIYFVALESVDGSAFISTAIAESLGIALTDSATANIQLTNYLRHRQLLLLVDNFEHLLDGADLLLSILQAAPGVKAMVTSRERLNFHGEWLFELGGLAYPEAPEGGGQYSHEVTEIYPAVQLFIRDATAVRSNFALDEELGPVVEICRWLDGMPLGIQLAAASVRAFSSHEILASIRENLDFLRTDMRNLPDRHRSLRAVFEHSWSLLTAAEQQALRQLAVFAGSFSIEAAEYVAGVSQTILRSLVNRSLIQPVGLEHDIDVQYKIHAVLRQYAAAKLESERQEEQSSRDRHASFFTELLVELEAQLEDSGAADALAKIGADLENIRIAWSRSVLYLNLDRIRLALPGLSRYYLLRGPFQEGSAALADAEQQLKRFLERSSEPQPKTRETLSHILGAQAKFFNHMACYDDALETAREAIAEAHQIGAVEAEALGYLHSAIALRFLGDFPAALGAVKRALRIARRHNMPAIEGESLVNIGVIYIFHDSRYDTAQPYLNDALKVYRDVGNRRQEGSALNGLGILHLYQGQYSEARVHYEQSLSAFREIGDRKGEALELNNLGVVNHHLGNFDAAHSYYQEALTIREQLGEFQGIGLTSGNLGMLAHHMGDHQAAHAYSVVAQRIADERGDRDSEAFALFCLANAQLSQGEVEESIHSFQRALELRLALGQVNQTFEAQAGLLRAELELGDTTHNRDSAEAILASMSENSLIGVVDPFAVYLTCYLVLKRVDEARAAAVLESAYQLLRERADRIRSTALRHTFLNSWPARRQLMEEYIRVRV